MDAFLAKAILLVTTGLAGDTIINALPDSANAERLGVAAVTVTILLVILALLWRELKEKDRQYKESIREITKDFTSRLDKIDDSLRDHHNSTIHNHRGDSKRYVTPLPVRGQSDGV